MDAVLHRIEALPGHGGYAVTFIQTDGTGQVTAVRVLDGQVQVSDAGLPPGWRRGTPAFLAVAAAVLAVDEARRHGATARLLHDVPGGWDVALGNVVLGADGPTCCAHGPMTGTGPVHRCAECGAQAVLH